MGLVTFPVLIGHIGCWDIRPTRAQSESKLTLTFHVAGATHFCLELLAHLIQKLLHTRIARCSGHHPAMCVIHLDECSAPFRGGLPLFTVAQRCANKIDDAQEQCKRFGDDSNGAADGIRFELGSR